MRSSKIHPTSDLGKKTCESVIMLQTESSTYSDESDDDEGPKNPQRKVQCGDFCALNIFKIPGLILRNILFPKDEWDNYPDGFNKIADRLLFHPRTEQDEALFTPEFAEITDEYEEIFIETKDKVKLHTYLIKCTTPEENKPLWRHSSSSCSGYYDFSIPKSGIDENQNESLPPGFYSSLPTVIYFHGNAGNIGMCCGLVKQFKYHPILAKLNWFLVEYRGYGKSQGKEREKGLYKDAEAAFNFIESRPDLDRQKIIIMGHSLGGAVAIYLASHPRFKNKIAGLITENTFTSIPEIGIKLIDYKFVKYLPNFIYSSLFKSIERIHKVKIPSLFICAENDNVVPCDMSERLYEKCGSTTKYLEKMKLGSHNDTYVCDDYFPAIAKFMAKVFNLPWVDTQKLPKMEGNESDSDEYDYLQDPD